jgi:hypothetical protein
MNWIYSPFIIPVAGISVAIVAIICGAVTQMHKSRLRADQRMALIARGMSPAEIESFLKTTQEDEQRAPKDPLRSLGNSRRAAVILISIGLGLIAFFLVLETILQVRPILAGAATGLIPLAIGIGFVVDYQMQKRELARFGLEIEAHTPRR